MFVKRDARKMPVFVVSFHHPPPPSAHPKKHTLHFDTHIFLVMETEAPSRRKVLGVGKASFMDDGFGGS